MLQWRPQVQYGRFGCHPILSGGTEGSEDSWRTMLLRYIINKSYYKPGNAHNPGRQGLIRLLNGWCENLHSSDLSRHNVRRSNVSEYGINQCEDHNQSCSSVSWFWQGPPIGLHGRHQWMVLALWFGSWLMCGRPGYYWWHQWSVGLWVRLDIWEI